MRFYEPLYIDENYKDVARIKRCIRFSRIPLFDYVIVLNNGKDQLDIIQGRVLKQKFFPKKKLFVVGISRDYDGAVELVQRILQDTYQKTGGYDMKAYLSRKA